MNLKFLAFLAAAFLTFSVVSCSDDDDTATNVENTLTSQDWKITSQLQNGSESIEDCTLDDKYTFASGGASTYDPGTDLCETDETTTTGTWTVSSNGETITFDGTVQTINSISSSRMELSFSFTDPIFGTGTVEIVSVFEPF